MNNLVEIAKICRPHGLKGALFCHAFAEAQSCLESLTQVFLGDSSSSAVPYSILETASMPKGWKVDLAGVNTLEEASSLCGKIIFTNRSSLPSISEGQYYVHDLIGLSAMDLSGNSLVGTIESVEFSGQERWWIRTADRELLGVPAHQHFIHQVDLEKCTVWLKNWHELVPNPS